MRLANWSEPGRFPNCRHNQRLLKPEARTSITFIDRCPHAIDSIAVTATANRSTTADVPHPAPVLVNAAKRSGSLSIRRGINSSMNPLSAIARWAAMPAVAHDVSDSASA